MTRSRVGQRRPRTAAAGGAALVALAGLVVPATAGSGTATSEPRAPELVSARPDGAPGDAQSGTFGLGISGDGRTTTFASLASDLDPRDRDADSDVYVAREGEAPSLVSVRADGVKGDATSTRPEISADGRHIAFLSASTNLDPRAADGQVQVYVKDLHTGVLVLGSTAPDGSPANGASWLPVLSGDGRFLAFASRASNLDPSDTDALPDAYVKDLQTGEVALVSVRADGVKAIPGFFGIGSVAVSGDGTHVAFSTDAPGLDPSDVDTTADVFVKDRLSGELLAVTPGAGEGASTSPSLSWTGHQVAFETYRRDLDPLDDDEESSVYVRDTDTGRLSLASVLPDGRGVGGRATQPSLSADGRTVAFAGDAGDLVTAPAGPGALQVYVRHLDAPDVVLASADVTGAPGPHLALDPALAGDASVVTFATPSALVPGDTNRWADVYKVPLAPRPGPPVEVDGIEVEVETADLLLGGAPQLVVTARHSARAAAGVVEVVTRVIDPAGVVRGVVRSPHEGDVLAVGAHHVLVPRSEVRPGAGQWRVRVLVRDVGGDLHIDRARFTP